MIEFFKKLFHSHKWKIIKQINVYDGDDVNTSNQLPIYTKYVLQCEICGDIKSRKI